jgi:phage tail sheath protein FI
MSDYLSPGVYIEELPPQLRAIEGVSTSTAGMVGVTERGPVPGFALPFTPNPTDPEVVTLVPTPTPVAVASFGDFTRQFGRPLSLPDATGNSYLAYAVKGFFDNGGQICYISRVLAQNATYSALRVYQGTVLQLTRQAQATDTVLYLNSLRLVDVGATALTLYSRSAGGAGTVLNITGYDARAKTVTLSAAVNKVLTVSDTYLIPQPSATSLGAATGTGPTFWAKNPGAWSQSLTVSISPSDRSGVSVLTGGASSAQQVVVQTTGSFYVGAIIEIDRGPAFTGSAQKSYHEVTAILPGGVLQLAAPVGGTGGFPATSLVRVVEIDITISDPTAIVPTSETYPGLTWNPSSNPVVSARHYANVINASSNLVYVQPPGVGGLSGSEAANIQSQPTTPNGFPASPAGEMGPAAITATGAVAEAVAAVQGVVTAIQALQTALPAQTLPIASTNPLVTTLLSAETAAQQAATDATTAATGATAAGDTAFATAATAAATQAQAANTAAATAYAQAISTTQTEAQINTVLTAELTIAQGALTAITTAANTLNGVIATAGTFLGDDGASPQPDDYIGVDFGPGTRTGIQALKDAEAVSIIAAPGQTDPSVQGELIDQCELLRYRFAVLDGEQNPAGGSVNAILAHRDNYDTSFAAYYVPWLQIRPNNQNVYLPPSGHVIGIYAATDSSRGVWKAPANVVVQKITGLKTYIVKGEQDLLNPAGVNAIRRFDRLGTRVWGARTLSSDSSLIYVNVRRTLIFLEASIDQGTQWVVFEPNTPDTWDRLTDSVTAFLTTQWADGALFGAKPADAFFVRCDETTMTADDIQNGRLICLIGVAIVRPAEFVIFRIEQTTGFANQ